MKAFLRLIPNRTKPGLHICASDRSHKYTTTHAAEYRKLAGSPVDYSIVLLTIIHWWQRHLPD
ncbi:MAG: hypothetical protein ABIO55_00040 [Ginsengibacter sp.]